MLSNAYFLAKFRFDTAENEPAKNLQNFPKFANLESATTRDRLLAAAVRPEDLVLDLEDRVRPEGPGWRSSSERREPEALLPRGVLGGRRHDGRSAKFR